MHSAVFRLDSNLTLTWNVSGQMVKFQVELRECGWEFVYSNFSVLSTLHIPFTVHNYNYNYSSNE